MRKILILAVVAFATPAVAARCPYGQILRVSLGKCVGIHSKLAQGYVRTLPRKRRIVVAAPPGPRPPITDLVYYPEPLEIPAEILRERLAHPSARGLTLNEILLSRAAAMTAEVK